MKILVFIKTFANQTLTFIYNEVTELAKSHEVKIITCERKNEHLFPFEDIVEIPFLKKTLRAKYQTKLQYLDLQWAFKNSKFEKRISTVIDEFKPDVIHTHFGFESWFFLENFHRHDIPIFVSFHGFDASHKLTSSRYRKAVKRHLNRPEVTPVFVSEFMQLHVEQCVEQQFNKAKILYYGTDIDFFERTNYTQKGKPFTFLQVSSFSEKKGHEFTVKSFAELLKKVDDKLSIKLILAGEGFLKNDIQDLVAELGIMEYVEFPGLVNRQQAKELMNQANTFVHHSVTSASVGDMEGIPNAIMEAMAMELPIISTFHSGIPELIENEVNGYLVEERDIEMYSQRMLAILSWKYERVNREKVIRLFEKKQHGKQLAGYYQEALNA
jgi:colanic acid/amylovoran biosynthesis glycosyltransferase